MNCNELKKLWQAEENIAYIHGWDFSHIEGRYRSYEDELPWDYVETVKKYLSDSKRLLDIDTGGGEVLLSFEHPYKMTSATEGYLPNAELCKERLLPRGIDFRFANDHMDLPFENDTFDIVVNRHGAYDIAEIKRILKDGGIFITQQVGDKNDRELVKLLCPDAEFRFGVRNLQNELNSFKSNGFTIVEHGECLKPIEFYEVGALVWFARIIQWEFIDFSVDNNFAQLLNAHQIISEKGSVSGSVHRFMIVAKK